MSFEGLLNDTATIKRKAAVTSPGRWGGDRDPEWDTVETAAVRLLPTSGRERGGGVEITTDTLMAGLSYGTDVTERDRLVISDVTYEVLNVTDAGGAHHHLEATVRRVK